MSVVINLVVTAAFLVGAYRLGLHDGRVMECRQGFKTVDDAPVVWDVCKERLGRGISR